MASPTALPTLLNLIFHGPWGFVVNAKTDTITAVTPDCSGHLYLMGDTPVLAAMHAGTYSFQGGAVSGVAPIPNQVTQTEVKSNFVMPTNLTANPPALRAFSLPNTPLNAAQYMQRTPQPANQPWDNLLSGRDFVNLNQPTAAQPVALAVIQVLTYSSPDFSDVVLGTTGGAKWRASVPYNANRASINLHIFAQTLDPHDTEHFTAMAGLFGLKLHLDGDDAMKPPTDAGTLPVGMTRDDLGEIGRRLQARPHVMLPNFPLLCGGSLVMRA